MINHWGVKWGYHHLRKHRYTFIIYPCHNRSPCLTFAQLFLYISPNLKTPIFHCALPGPDPRRCLKSTCPETSYAVAIRRLPEVMILIPIVLRLNPRRNLGAILTSEIVEFHIMKTIFHQHRNPLQMEMCLCKLTNLSEKVIPVRQTKKTSRLFCKGCFFMRHPYSLCQAAKQ